MGFGQYNRLNSQLLHDIAFDFDGMFGYIPDPTNIGTIFVNGISNIMTQAFNQVKLSFKLNPEVLKKCKKVMVGKLPHKIEKDHPESAQYGTIHVNFGALRYGQDLEILLEFDSPIDDLKEDFASAEITYETNGNL